MVQWPKIAEEIQRLKAKRNAVILAHNYDYKFYLCYNKNRDFVTVLIRGDDRLCRGLLLCCCL